MQESNAIASELPPPHPSAGERQLAALDKTPYENTKSKIADLTANPRPPGCRKLKERAGWRVRTGDYRILYDINDAATLVTILEVGHRREIYR